jgi:hypothetical protein
MRYKSCRMSLALALLLAGSAVPGTASPPVKAGVQLAPTLKTDAGALTLLVCGVRDTLWVDHYVAALYVAPGASTQAVLDPAAPKAVRMHMVDSRYLPRDLPKKWREPLRKGLEQQAYAHVRAAFSQLGDGDVVTITYMPQEGVNMRVNGRTLATAQGHNVIDSILAAWAEREPVAQKLKTLAANNSC